MKCICLITFTLMAFNAGLSQPVLRNDIVIDEIMADPSPALGLPNAEFIELKNVSSQPINLNGFKIGDATSTATINSNFILPPDSFVIICSSASAPALAIYGATIGITSFPSLDNDGETLYLLSKENKLIHAAAYQKAWYNNSVKEEGGWTLEMIDPHNACSGSSNWKASMHASGGTPGKINSVNAVNSDKDAPFVIKAFATDSFHVTVIFNEPLDSSAATIIANYNISDGLDAPLQAKAIAPLFDRVSLQLSTSLEKNKIYTLKVKSVSDCSGNTIDTDNNSRLGWASIASEGNIIINEILFNPKPGGVDYVELYNRSSSIVDLKDLYIANRSATGTIGSLKQVSLENSLVFPGDFVLISDDIVIVRQQYLVKESTMIVELASMPSFPDDKGTILLLNAQGLIIDELQYDEKWHFPLIDNAEGVALERIDYNKPTQDKQNWHSAATSAGYGTPGYQNSQYHADAEAQGSITVTPAVFSPDNDGFDDVATVSYQFPEPGYVCNISIFDVYGRPVKYLVQNAICGIKGYYRWDGLDEQNKKLNIGNYIVLTEVFSVTGKTKKYKKVIVLARRLK